MIEKINWNRDLQTFPLDSKHDWTVFLNIDKMKLKKTCK